LPQREDASSEDAFSPEEARGTAKPETADWPAIVFPTEAVVGKAERAIEHFYSQVDADPDRLVLDLSSSVFIEIATLQLLTSLIIRRHRLRKTTKFRLPAGDRGLNARHFLRRWHYPEVFDELFQKKHAFSLFVDKADHAYFAGSPTGGDRGDPYAGAVLRYEDRHGEVRYRKEVYRFLALRTWLISQDTDKRQFVEGERKRWKDADPLVAETLNRRLRMPATPGLRGGKPNNEKLVVGRIVFQAITNALRHPRASLLQASSHMEDRFVPAASISRAGVRADNFFTLVYWDDGEPMHRTLRRALDDDLPIHHSSGFTLKTTYLVNPKKAGETLCSPRIISSAEIPTKHSSDEELLISTIFPGITCDVDDAERLAALGMEDDDPMLGMPGHGLFVLVRTAVELFGGSVAFRTGNFFMNVSYLTDDAWMKQRLHDRKPAYKIKLRKSEPAFLGNMVTVRLPLT
jgi:hypothetical protein